MLDERVAAFNTAAHAARLDYLRYGGDFFVGVFAPRPEEAAAHMRASGVFVVPIPGALRVALRSTAAREVPRLVQALSAALSATSN